MLSFVFISTCGTLTNVKPHENDSNKSDGTKNICRSVRLSTNRMDHLDIVDLRKLQIVML